MALRTGLIIGATGGIGSACVAALDGSADLMVLVGRRKEALDDVAAATRSRTELVAADLAKPEARGAIAAAVEGEIGWLVIASGVPLREPLVQLTESAITNAFTVNFLAPTLLLRALLGRDWCQPGSVVVIGSVSASRSLPNRAVYAATKAGIEHLARSLAPELAQSDIRINIVSPGVIETPFLGDDQQRLRRWVQERVPAKRAGSPSEIASVVRYAALEAPAYLTGARLVVDGGVEAWA